MYCKLMQSCLTLSLLVLTAVPVLAAPEKAKQPELTLAERGAVGYYRSSSEKAAVQGRNGRLYFLYPPAEGGSDPDLWNSYYLEPQRGSTYELREVGPTTRAVSSLVLEKGDHGGLRINQRSYSRFVPDGAPSLVPEPGEEPDPMARDEEALVGFYRGNGAICAVREEKGKLQLIYRDRQEDADMTRSNIYALNKLHYDAYELKETGPNTDASTPVRFDRDRSGWGISMIIGSQSYTRVFTRGETGKPRRIRPAVPLKDLRAEAAAAAAPELPYEKTADLVDLESAVPGIHLDLRYTTADNLFGEPLVLSRKAFLDKNAAAALAGVQQKLAPYGYGLLIWEGYRSWVDFYVASKALGPSHEGMLPRPEEGYSHNSGRSVDVSLYDLETGENVSMISDFDEISSAQYAAFPGGTQLSRWRRDLLRRLMTEAGFAASPDEWWHFDFDKAHSYKILNETMS